MVWTLRNLRANRSLYSRLVTYVRTAGVTVPAVPESVTITYSSGWESTSEFPAGGSDEGRLSIVAAEEWRVRERWFAADVSLSAAGYSAEYFRTPLVDYAMALRYSLEMAAVDGLSRFSASGGPVLVLVRRGNCVEIRQGPGTEAVVEFAELVSACARFRRLFIDEVTARFPDLLLNELIERLFRDSGLRGASRDRFLRHSRAVKLRNELA